ncbi:hypothetical protein K1719_039903 [Acacia pycnantha]|nr:hypothetical protein K1719_039903 [Acacia pycnantha]
MIQYVFECLSSELEIAFRTVIMEKAGGRPRDEVWQHVKLLEGGRRVKCNYCEYGFAASANRIKSHINKGKGIRVCPNFPQSHNFASDNKGNSNHVNENFLHSQVLPEQPRDSNPCHDLRSGEFEGKTLGSKPSPSLPSGHPLGEEESLPSLAIRIAGGDSSRSLGAQG